MSLDVIRAYTGLEQMAGPDALYMSDRSATSSLYLVSPHGLPVNLGWFDNSRKSASAPSHYALTTYPREPKNMHHRLMMQQRDGGDYASLVEEDSYDAIEWGLGPAFTLSSVVVEQPELAERVRGLLLGACVLNATTGHDLAAVAWQNPDDVALVREYGKGLVETGNFLIRLDDATFNELVVKG